MILAQRNNPEFLKSPDSPDELVLLPRIDSVVRAADKDVKIVGELNVNSDQECVRIEEHLDVL